MENYIEVIVQDKQKTSGGGGGGGGVLLFKGLRLEALLGEAGGIEEAHKIEGDGKTPLGLYDLLYFFWRADKLPQPQTALRGKKLEPSFGWCDDSTDKAYNKFVQLPYPARAENLWRDDGLYDLIVVLGFNNNPPQANRGSAIFMHCAARAPDNNPTKGCVALAKADLIKVLALCDEETKIKITLESARQK